MGRRGRKRREQKVGKNITKRKRKKVKENI
jgi:hypothetical protein